MEKSEIILFGIAIVAVILIIFFSLGFRITKSGSGSADADASNNYANLPEKCRPPAGQDIEAWKEHLSHHAETKDCLKYFR